MKEMAAERAAARSAIERLRLAPVLFELGARPHAPRDLYLAYIRRSHVVVAIYGEQYGWVAPGMDVSGLEDEYLAAVDLPKLTYIHEPAADRLQALLDRISSDGLSYRRFATTAELGALLIDDLAVLMSERFATPERDIAASPASRRLPAPISTFVGRERELRELHALFADPEVRLITLTGAGGVGNPPGAGGYPLCPSPLRRRFRRHARPFTDARARSRRGQDSPGDTGGHRGTATDRTTSCTERSRTGGVQCQPNHSELQESS